jgi:hypothetical protein
MISILLEKERLVDLSVSLYNSVSSHKSASRILADLYHLGVESIL